MENIIKRLGFKYHYWFGILAPPMVIFGYWFVEDSALVQSFVKNIEDNIFDGYLPGQIALFFLVIILGILVPLLVLSKIKCPQCNTKIVLHALNHSRHSKEMQNPYSSLVCPKCGFNP